MIERQFLRIAQTRGDNFQIRAIRIAAKDGPAGRIGQRAAVLLDVITPIADAEIDPPVRSHDQPMRIVSAKGDSNAVSSMERQTNVGLVVSILVSQQPQIRDTGEDPALFVNAEADRIGQQRSGRDQSDLYVSRLAKPLDRQLPFIGGLGDLRSVGSIRTTSGVSRTKSSH